MSRRASSSLILRWKGVVGTSKSAELLLPPPLESKCLTGYDALLRCCRLGTEISKRPSSVTFASLGKSGYSSWLSKTIFAIVVSSLLSLPRALPSWQTQTTIDPHDMHFRSWNMLPWDICSNSRASSTLASTESSVSGPNDSSSCGGVFGLARMRSRRASRRSFTTLRAILLRVTHCIVVAAGFCCNSRRGLILDGVPHQAVRVMLPLTGL